MVEERTAGSLIDELYLMGRLFRVAITSPEEGQLLPGSMGVLALLSMRGRCRQNELAADMCISQSALSRQVSDLVANGYIARDADPHDGRASLISLTDDGVELLRRTRARHARQLAGMLADWSEDDARAACHTIHKLKDALATNAHHATGAVQVANKKELHV
ncbi:MAG TPA: MarR family transcriptional regulator [Aldersonia sp.]